MTGEVREACTASADRVANAILGEVLCEPARCEAGELCYKIKITKGHDDTWPGGKQTSISLRKYFEISLHTE